MFATRTELMPHQATAVAKLLPSRVGAAFMDMGTGKSRTLIELAKIRQDKWDRLFWFTPCALRENVHEQVLLHTDLTDADIEIWDNKALDRGIRDVRVHIVGIESMSSSDRVVFAYARMITEKSYVVVDESSYIKGHSSQRTQRITAMSEKCRYRTILTGTPLTQGAVDLYAQMKFLSPKILGYRSFWSFSSAHLEYEYRKTASGRKRNTGRILRSHNEDYLAAKIAPYTYQVRKDECLDLPGKLYSRRYTTMTEAQRDLYEETKHDILSMDYDDWSPIRIFHLFASLQSIVCGFLGSPGGAFVEVPHNRISLLIATVAEIPDTEKVIIWAKYHHAVQQICDALSAAYGADSVCPYYGGQSSDDREKSLRRWRAGARFLVATQSIGGHGLTLTEASYTIFYADSFKYSERIQSEDRTHRIGQTRRPVYISLHCSKSIDDRIAKAIYCKGSVLRSFQRQVDVYRADGMRQKAIDLVRSL